MQYELQYAQRRLMGTLSFRVKLAYAEWLAPTFRIGSGVAIPGGGLTWGWRLPQILGGVLADLPPTSIQI